MSGIWMRVEDESVYDELSRGSEDYGVDTCVEEDAAEPQEKKGEERGGGVSGDDATHC